MEIFKDIEGYEGKYQVSNLGNVRSLKYSKPNILKSGDNGRGYRYVSLRKCGMYKNLLVHRLVAKTFLDNEFNKTDVNHINGIKTDNNINNLEWATRTENNKHSYSILGREPKGAYSRTKCAKFSINGELIKEYNSIQECETENKLTKSIVSKGLQYKDSYLKNGFVYKKL